MKIVATEVYPDEECHGYFTGPDRGRMVEKVFVIRGDAIACYERDFGPVDEWPYTPPLVMPSFGENSVAEMQEWGERHRHDDRWAKKMVEYRANSTLLKDAAEQAEKIHKAILNQTTIGPYGSVQRNGYSRITNWRNYRDERNKRTGKTQL